MTVAQLLAELQSADPALPVFIYDADMKGGPALTGYANTKPSLTGCRFAVGFYIYVEVNENLIAIEDAR